jgi:type II secretion system protein H
MKKLNEHRGQRANSGTESARPQSRARTAHSSSAFTLIELILVMTLLVVITSMVVPRLAGFVRGRALDSEARRMAALMHAAQGRAVSEGMPMMFWVDEKAGTYGVEAETSGPQGDPKGEDLTLDSTLGIVVQAAVGSTQVTFKNLPAIRFLADGTVDEGSPQFLKLTDSAGYSRWLAEASNHLGYEIDDTPNQAM